MQKKTTLITCLILMINSAFNMTNAQTFSNAGEYMSYISKEMDALTKNMWDYTSAAAHGKSARKVENRRKDLLKTSLNVQKKISQMPDFQGDKSLRDTVKSFLKLSYNVLNNDYAKVVDMEEIAEQSYDAMEAYLLAQEKADEKLDQACTRLNVQQKLFANSHDIKLIESKDKISTKLESAGKVFKYYNVIYLVFFKSNKQEAYLMDALNKVDMNGVEQNKNSLLTFSTAGILVLDTIKAFKGDASLKMACKEALAFYKAEASTKIPEMINFYLKKENFDKIKSAFDAKSPSSRTKADVDQFNKAVNDFNAATAKYNTINDELNKKRSTVIEKWNGTVLSFMDKQVPKYK